MLPLQLACTRGQMDGVVGAWSTHDWLHPLRPRRATAAVLAPGKQTGGELGIMLVVEQESKGRSKKPQPEREDKESRDRPCQEFCVCPVNANQGQEITTDTFSWRIKAFFISMCSLGS